MDLHTVDNEIRVIEFHMLENTKYYPLTVLSAVTVRGMLYPSTLIRTRLQVQTGRSVYKGTYDAFRKIVSSEGIAGLYRGFGVSCMQVAPSLLYITVYENVRQWVSGKIETSHIRSMLAGGAASFVNQCFMVPLDIVMQHMMLLGQRKSLPDKRVELKLQTLQRINISDDMKHSRFGAVTAIVKEIHRIYGVRGFYKGYGVSLAVFTPSSMLWWLFYDFYGGCLVATFPVYVPRMIINCIAAPSAGITTTLLTNPIDLLRTRIQVNCTDLKTTWNILWREEGLNIWTKGLSARMINSSLFSFMVAFGYESVKRLSLKDEYKSDVRW